MAVARTRVKHRAGARIVRRSTLLTTSAAIALLWYASADAATAIKTGGTYKSSEIGSKFSPDFEGGTLQIDQAGTIDNAFTVGEVSTNTIDASGKTATFTGAFTDAVTGDPGPITITDSAGGGNIVFTSADNTYSGATTINSGATFSLTGVGTIKKSSLLTDNGVFDISGTTSGASVVSLAGSGNVILGAQNLTLTGGSGTFSGVISGTGALIQSGGTTQILSGNNTYTGGTTVSFGTLQIGAGGTTGSVVGDIVDLGTVAFDRSDSVAFDGVVSGSGALTQTGSGILSLSKAQTYTGATTISAGTLALTGNADISSSSGVAANGTLDLSALAGPVTLRSLSGSGAVVLGSNALTISNGAGGTAGTFSGAISGTGAFTLAGGTEFLSGTNTYTGGTTVLSGATLQIGSGSGSAGSIVGDVADAGTLSFNFSSATAFAGTISGAGNVVQAGGGTANLSTVQQYTGTTTITGGILALTGLGSIENSSALIDNGTFDIANSANTVSTVETLSGNGAVTLGDNTLSIANAAGTFAGAISGAGSLLVAGGSETLSGANTYTGDTTIAAGSTLALSGSKGAIASSGDVVDDGTFDISTVTTPARLASLSGSGVVSLGGQTLILTNAAGTFSGQIHGTGAFMLSGGTETLVDAIGYSGATTISAGTLVLQGNNAVSLNALTVNGILDATGLGGASPITVTSLAGSGSLQLGSKALDITNSNGFFSGAIVTTGGVIVDGGTQTFTGAESYTGGTTINGGTLQIGSGGTAGSIAGDILDNATLAFNRSDTLTYGGAISGSGAVNQIGPGTTILTGTNSYTGGTLISRGTLQIGDGSADGTLVGDVVDNGVLAFDRSDSVAFGGSISGSGGLTQMGAGTLTLTGANSFTGAATIGTAGRLALTGSGSIETAKVVADNGVLDISGVTGPAKINSLSGTGSVALGTQTLTLVHAADTFAGKVNGSGGLSLTGGTETLSGSSTYTGATSVTGGILAVNGSIASSSGITVGSGGTLTGTGHVASTIVQSSGTLAPGAAGSGILSIDGALTMQSGSTYLVNMSSTSASKTVVAGAASINGSTLSLQSATGGFLAGEKLTVLTANGGITGTFDFNAPSTAGGKYSYALSYDADDVFLQISLAHLTPFLAAGATRNQLAVAGGIDAAIAAGDTLPMAFENLGNLSAKDLAAALDQMSGELGADLPQLSTAQTDQFVNTLFAHMDTFHGGRSKTRVRSGSGPDFWLSVSGGHTSVDADANAHGSSTNDLAVSGGVDWQPIPNAILGGAVSVGSNHLSVPTNLGRANDTAVQLAGYGYVQFSPHTYGAGTALLGFDQVKSHRTLTVSGTDDLTASFSGLSFAARYETGLYFGWVTPYIAVQSEGFRTPQYHETAASGSNDFALDYDGRTSSATRLELGIGESGNFDIDPGMLLNFNSKFAWGHNILSTGAAGVSFVALPSSDFTVIGAQPASDVALISFGAKLIDVGVFSFGARFDGAFGQHAHSAAGTATVDFAL